MMTAEGAEPVDSNSDRTAAGELMLRAFGPLADALGQELSKAPAFVVANMGRLATVFQRKRHSRDNSETPSTRLFKQVLDETAWADDPIVLEYLGGVLAASSGTALQDRGVTVTSTVRRLSALQLRAHYVFYHELLRLGPPKRLCDLRPSSNRGVLHLEMNVEELLQVLGIDESSVDEQRELTTHIVLGLAREQLIDDDTWNLPDWERETSSPRRLAVHPSPLGAELYLWGGGSVVTDQARFFDPSLELVPIDGVGTLSSAELDVEKEAFDVARMDIERHLLSGRVTAATNLLKTLAKDVQPTDAHIFYYSALIASLSGDTAKAERDMQISATHASAIQIRMGLDTLAKMADRHPSRFEELHRLGEILELGRPVNR